MKNTVKQMLEEIQRDAEYTDSMTGIKKFKDETLSAFKKVPRDAFVPDHLKHMAFQNSPLPIGHGQTISQPYIVALMTELLNIKPDHTILEIGTGSGYQSAILSTLCKQVYTVELITELSTSAKKRFEELHYDNIEAVPGNGYDGFPKYAPYDGIIVTAAATHIPQPLIEQLKAGGNLVIPLNVSALHQELMLLEKDLQGNTQIRRILGVMFVPLIDAPVKK